MSGRILVVEQHGLVAMGLQAALSSRAWDVATSCGPSAPDVVAVARCFEPQCVLLDTQLGDRMGSGIDLIGPMRSAGSQVVMLTAERRHLVLAECIEAGAAGWINRGATLDELDATVDHVIEGRTIIGRSDRAALLDELQTERAAALRAQAVFESLSKREALVLSELIDGLSAEEIAEAHFVALTTVRSQIHSVLHKLGVRSQVAAVAVATAHRDLLPRPSRAGHDRRRAHYTRRTRSVPAFRTSATLSA